ncbi:MAG: prolyl oligopeptidase family serine peptidase [Prevotella sp.]|nr:prolyl oligopeptidase family serine peptidase [Prevotella sp.]
MMKQTRLITSVITLMAMLCLFSASANAGSGKWLSVTAGCEIAYTTHDTPKQPALDYNGKRMTVVYLTNLACEKIGRVSNEENIRWLLDEGYQVIELDYGHHAMTVSPYINRDIIAINKALNKGEFCGMENISADRAYILFEGYRIRRDVAYCKDNPTVYNYPEEYKTMEGDTLYMDIVYPENPSRRVPTILSFAYSNSYAGTAGEGYTAKYRHKRMFLGYTLAMFNDSFLEGAPAAGMAWAIADHPKYCDWGRGNRTDGRQKEFGSIEINPDAARKVHAAIRKLRSEGRKLRLGKDIALYGFSRGSTAASLAIGDAPHKEWTRPTDGLSCKGSSKIQAALLGPGVFDYAAMSESSREYKNMTTYCSSVRDSAEAWRQQGGIYSIKHKSVPCFLFYNTTDDAEYATQMKRLTDVLDRTGSTYEMLTDYGKGHSVPQETDHLNRMYCFLKKLMGK